MTGRILRRASCFRWRTTPISSGRPTQDEIVLSVSKDGALGVVRLSWTGTQPAYNVERASRADFSDGVVVAPSVPGPTYDDPVLADGNSWFYRVR